MLIVDGNGVAFLFSLVCFDCDAKVLWPVLCLFVTNLAKPLLFIGLSCRSSAIDKLELCWDALLLWSRFV